MRTTDGLPKRAGYEHHPLQLYDRRTDESNSKRQFSLISTGKLTRESICVCDERCSSENRFNALVELLRIEPFQFAVDDEMFSDCQLGIDSRELRADSKGGSSSLGVPDH